MGVDARPVVARVRDALFIDVTRKNSGWAVDQVGAEADRKLRYRYGPLLAFADERSQQPEGREWTKSLANSFKKVFNLHAGEDRGVTWWDRDVVWLLTVGFHRSGSRGDFYPGVVKLDKQNELMPTREDFLSADPDPTAEYLRDLGRKGRALLDMARENPFTDHGDLIAQRVTLGVYVEVYVVGDDRAEEVWIRVRATPDHHGSDIIRDVLVNVIPEAAPADISFPQKHPVRRIESGERIICWACP